MGRTRRPAPLPRSSNPQARNVGNLGDILKHAALCELAAMLAERSARVRYLETHTFLLHAPIADTAWWHGEVDTLAGRLPAHARYRELERAALSSTGEYRCSAGLVMDVLGPRRANATLGEADGRTRATLREQIRDERLADVFVADDASAALRHAGEDEGGAVLVHVDPFKLTPEAWAPLAAGLDTVSARAEELVLVAYRYTRQGRSAWPRAPMGAIGPVAEVRGGPHEVAAYASPNLEEAVREICCSLGWQGVERVATSSC